MGSECYWPYNYYIVSKYDDVDEYRIVGHIENHRLVEPKVADTYNIKACVKEIDGGFLAPSKPKPRVGWETITINPRKVDISNEMAWIRAYAEMQDARSRQKKLRIEKVIFNDPATIVIWKDGTKTVVKAANEPFDPEKGLAMAITKKVLGNEGNYYNTFREWLPKKETVEEKEEIHDEV